jgi:hypothetical protein
MSYQKEPDLTRETVPLKLLVATYILPNHSYQNVGFYLHYMRKINMQIYVDILAFHGYLLRHSSSLFKCTRELDYREGR